MKTKERIERYETLKSGRANWDSLWREVATLCHPNQDDIFGSFTSGQKKGLSVFDGSPVHANVLLASALHGMLTNPASYWFGLKTGVREIDEMDDVRKWLQDSAFSIHDTLNSSNFQTEIIEVYLALGSIGTWVLYMDEDDERIVNFSARPIYHSQIAENKRGEVDEIYRTEKWTKKQLIEKWGKIKPTQPKKWLEKLERKKDTDEFEVLHSCYPRGVNSEGALPSEFRFASCYDLVQEKLPIHEGGFHEFPYAVPRWSKISGEKHGRSPAMNSLADIKMLQAIMKTQIKGLQKTVDPPLLVADEGVIGQLKLTPGGTTYFRAGMERPIIPIQTDSRVDYGFQALAELRTRIEKAFFIDQLQLKDGPQMTALEVQRRTEQQLRLMGPILGRLHHELIRPIVSRVFQIKLRRGLLPNPIPSILSKRKLQIQYSSMIAKAQRAGEADDIMKGFGLMAPFFQSQPGLQNIVNGEAACRKIANILDWSQDLIRDSEEFKQIQSQQQADMMRQKQMMDEQHEAQVTKDAGPVALEAARMGQEETVGQ